MNKPDPPDDPRRNLPSVSLVLEDGAIRELVAEFSRPFVLDAVVIPRLKDGQPDSLSAFVTLKNVTSLTKLELTRTLKQELSQHLPAYMLPRKFHFLDTFPMTPNGKVDRRKLAETLQ